MSIMSGSRDGVDIMDYSGSMQCETQVYPRNGMNLVVDEHGKGPFSRVVLEVYIKNTEQHTSNMTAIRHWNRP